MRRSLLKGLVLSLAGVVGSASAAEPVAVTSTRTPIATSSSPGAAQTGAVTLERPRIARGVSSDTPPPPLPTGIVPAVLRLTPKPAPTGVRPADLEEEALDDGSTAFAIERVAFVAAEPIPMPKAPGVVTGSAEPQIAYSDGAFEEQEAPASANSGFYGSGEYLLWWTKRAAVPALFTTSTQPFNFSRRVGPFSGAQDDPNRTVLFGDQVGGDLQQGARVRLGYWFDTCKPFAVEGSYFFLAKRTDRFSTNSDVFPGIFRPFRDSSGFENIQIVASPGISRGAVSVEAPTKLNGWDLNARCPIWCDEGCAGSVNVNLLGGFRAVRLQDGLYITEFGQNDPNPPRPIVANRIFRVDDRFDTDNRFYGAQIGLQTQFARGPWSLDLRTLVAIGNMKQVLTISGQTITVDPGVAPQSVAGGLLALPGLNIGRFERNRFAVVPEIGLTLGYQVTDNLRVTAGYNFLFLSSVLRPGDQIDRTLNAARIPGFGGVETGLNRPAVVFRDTTYWAQGFTAGAEYRY